MQDENRPQQGRIRLEKRIKKDEADPGRVALNSVFSKLDFNDCLINEYKLNEMEGFFLNMGDMLVKNGDEEKAVKIYNIAKQIPQYKDWDYKDVLEKRISNVKENVEKFRQPIDNQKTYEVDDVMMIYTPIACMSCHKMGQKDRIRYKDFDWEEYKTTHNIYWTK